MEVLNNITSMAKGITNLVGSLLGLAVFAELLFGSFLGDVSVVGNIVDVVARIGNEGTIGLFALILILYFFNKK